MSGVLRCRQLCAGVRRCAPVCASVGGVLGAGRDWLARGARAASDDWPLATGHCSGDRTQAQAQHAVSAGGRGGEYE